MSGRGKKSGGSERAGKRGRSDAGQSTGSTAAASAASAVAPGAGEAEAETAILPDELLRFVFSFLDLDARHDWERPPAVARVCRRWRAVAGVSGEPLTLVLVSDVRRGQPMRMAELAKPNKATAFLRAAARCKAPDEQNPQADFERVRLLGELPAAAREQLAYPCETAAEEVGRRLLGRPTDALRLMALEVRRDTTSSFHVSHALRGALAPRALLRAALRLPLLRTPLLHGADPSARLLRRLLECLAAEAPQLEELRVRDASGALVEADAGDLPAHPNLRRLGLRIPACDYSRVLSAFPRLEWVHALEAGLDSQGDDELEGGDPLRELSDRGVACRSLTVFGLPFPSPLPFDLLERLLRPASGPAALGPAELALRTLPLPEAAVPRDLHLHLAGLQRLQIELCDLEGSVALLRRLAGCTSLRRLELQDLKSESLGAAPTAAADALLSALQALSQIKELSIRAAWSWLVDRAQESSAAFLVRLLRGAAASPALLRRCEIRADFDCGPEVAGALAAFQAAKAAL
eukprot:tig00020710_g13277.t1